MCNFVCKFRYFEIFKPYIYTHILKFSCTRRKMEGQPEYLEGEVDQI